MAEISPVMPTQMASTVNYPPKHKPRKNRTKKRTTTKNCKDKATETDEPTLQHIDEIV